MLVKTIIDEDFTNYKIPSMFIGACYCDWKCPRELGFPVNTCQNQPLNQQPNINISDKDIVDRYLNNPITSAIVIGGLEPFLQFEELVSLIECFRKHINDDVVIYTGYYPDEIELQTERLKQFKNIIIKYGRYVSNQESHYDSVLGVNLASNNQYAEKIS